ncbi:MAG: metallophosphoesterase family protein [Sandaracinus sp.]
MRARPLFLFSALLAACSTPAPTPADGSNDEDAGIEAGPADAASLVDAAVPMPTDAPIKGPFVMQPTTTSVVVRWESVLEPAHVEVDYAPESGGTMVTADGTARLTHVLLDYAGPANHGVPNHPDVPGDYYVSEVAITGLTPATCYTYSIAGYPLDHGRFCTMHEASDHTTPIHVYAIGDTSPALQQTLRILSHTSPATADFTIHVGDLQYYSTIIETQSLWFDLMQPLLRANAFMPCEGNHESEIDHELDDIYARLFDHPGDTTDTTWWYHYETGGVHFLSLSTERDITVGSEQWSWLDQTMTRIEAEPGYRFTVVYFHRPIYGVASYAPNLQNRAAIEQVITAHRVPLVLAGHMHNYERFQIGNVTHVTTGSGGFSDPEASLDDNVAAFPEDAAHRVASGAFFEAMEITIVPDPGVAGGDVIQCAIVDEMGTTQDSFEIHVPPPT